MAHSSPKASHPVLVPRPDEVLAERYNQLRAWAVGLTRGDVQTALDIVHDLYLYVALAKPDFNRVENLDNYLYKCLRHIHLAHLSESSRNAWQQISTVELDSLGFASWTNSAFYALERQNELRRICHYVVSRKIHAKSASLFILRFFHDYHLQEIAEIANASLAVVQPNLSRMRAELQRYLKQPSEPQSAGAAPEELPWTPISSAELYRELRATVMRARNGDCLAKDELLAHYLTAVPKAISCSLLSHLVSCERCLSILDRHFRRPTLQDRGPIDGPGAGKRHSRITGRSVDSMSHKELMRIVLRRRPDLYHYRPQILSIAVDGKIIASHHVEARRSVQSLRIERPEKFGCVEVFSEQDVRLALVLLENLPPQGPAVKTERIELSHGRWLEVKLIFDSLGLNSEVTYFDPLLPVEAGESIQEYDAPAVPIAAAPIDVVPIRIVPESPAEASPAERWADHKSNSEDTEAGHRAAWWSRLCSKVKRMSIPDMNPLLAGAMILLIASLACFVTWMYKQPAITASALLERTEKWDAGVSGNAQPGVIYQKVRITTRRRTLERTIYRDVQGIRRSRRRQLSLEDEQLKNKLTTAGVNWDAPLSVVDYAQWRHRSGATRDAVTRSGQHLLTLSTTPVAEGVVLKETLTVRDIDFHAVDRTVELRDGGTVEIAELNYDVLPWVDVNQDWFEPLVGQAGTDAPGMHAAIYLPHVLSDVELNEAELAARTTLNQLHADTGEPIHITRRAAGIDIKGVVDTDARKRELLSHLALLPNVHSSILSAEEIGTHPSSRSTFGNGQPIQVHSVEAQASPLEQYLREKNLPTDQLASISHNLLDGGLRISQAEIHLSELQPRFKEVNQLPIGQQRQLATLSLTYLGTIETGLDANKHILQSLGFDNTGQTTAITESTDPAGGPHGDIDEQIRRYRQLCLELIINGTGQSRSAAAIAEELINTSERIRLRLATISATIPKDSN
jgi:RNA polymerase sigma factor (sigma-70 family)